MPLRKLRLAHQWFLNAVMFILCDVFIVFIFMQKFFVMMIQFSFCVFLQTLLSHSVWVYYFSVHMFTFMLSSFYCYCHLCSLVFRCCLGVCFTHLMALFTVIFKYICDRYILESGTDLDYFVCWEHFLITVANFVDDGMGVLALSVFSS